MKNLTVDQRNQISAIMAAKPDCSAQGLSDHIAEIMGLRIPRRTLTRWMAKSRRKQARKESGDVVRKQGTGNETSEVTLEAQRIVTLEDALEKGDVDLDQWDVERWVVNSWEVGARGPDKRIRVTPLWQVKVWLKAKKGWSAGEFRKILVDDMRGLCPSYRVPVYRGETEPVLAEISIFDAHFGKLGWAPETGQDYDLNICRNRYMTAGRDLIARASREKPERIVYVVGNDFFHVDHKGKTTNDTPQDCDGRWQKAFRVGWQCCATLAEEASQVCPVDVLVVPGNHDREKVFCLGDVLGARFHNNHVVNVMNSPDVYSYYRWGKVLLGFVHGDAYGNKAKRAELPIQMADDRPRDWAETSWREWHLGHFHSEQEDVWKYRRAEAVRSHAVRVLPSLSSTDAWHRQQGYASVLAAECHLYHKTRGRLGYLTHTTEA